MNLATVEKIEEVKNHPNADRLDLVRVLNFWAIVPRDRYKAGDLCVYIQPDSVLPDDREWAATYLAYTRKGRVRAVRLRGEWSEGIVLDADALYCDDLSQLVDDRDMDPEFRTYQEIVGADVTEYLGVTKHNPHSQVPELDIGFYSVWNIDERRYEGPNDKHYYEKVCAALDLPTVPMIEKQVPLTYELLEKYDTGTNNLNDQSFEGVVIKGDEFHCKVLNKFYDSEK